MNLRVVVLLTLAATSTAFAQESLEKVVVRNRLFTPGGGFELGGSVGFTLVNELVDHTNFTLDLAFNVTDTLAFEAKGGWAYSHHTGLADQISTDLLANQVTQNSNNGWPNVVDDMANLWEMKGNGVLGVRWAPIYGKISLLAEIPVHFQAYLWLGGGAGQFQRQSVVYCLQPQGPNCGSFETEQKVTWLASAAFGLRFFIFGGNSIKLEARSYVWPDSYLVAIDRRVEGSQSTGVQAAAPGITNLLLFDLGYSYVF